MGWRREGLEWARRSPLARNELRQFVLRPARMSLSSVDPLRVDEVNPPAPRRPAPDLRGKRTARLRHRTQPGRAWRPRPGWPEELRHPSWHRPSAGDTDSSFWPGSRPRARPGRELTAAASLGPLRVGRRPLGMAAARRFTGAGPLAACRLTAGDCFLERPMSPESLRPFPTCPDAGLSQCSDSPARTSPRDGMGRAKFAAEKPRRVRLGDCPS